MAIAGWSHADRQTRSLVRAPPSTSRQLNVRNTSPANFRPDHGRTACDVQRPGQWAVRAIDALSHELWRTDQLRERKVPGKSLSSAAASSGIGLATAKRFVEERAFVYITGRRQTELDKAVFADRLQRHRSAG